MFNDTYAKRRILLTGDTGFKGSWMRFWLEQLGAEVRGYSQSPAAKPNHFDLLGFESRESEDILDIEHMQQVFEEFRPEIVFHLAAQAIVRISYENPLETLRTNILGTANILECCRKMPTVRAVVVITSDKCYENREQIWGYREMDPMGGFDPYSASKGCAELVVSSFRNSFFDAKNQRLASARAGNVIGGGDWAKDRLVPDLMRNAAKGEKTKIRNPLATRPWQHVLEPISGYLFLAERMFNAQKHAEQWAEAWNFGIHGSVTNVEQAANALQRYWDEIQWELVGSDWHEAQNLTLDCTKANQILGWHGVWSLEKTFEYTARWYRNFYKKKIVTTNDDLNQYIQDAEAQNLPWAA